MDIGYTDSIIIKNENCLLCQKEKFKNFEIKFRFTSVLVAILQC